MRRIAAIIAIVCLPVGAAVASPEPRIINGHPAQPGAYPWAAALVSAELPAERGQFCGGSLIGPDLVLTAAHCLYGASPADVDVVIGRHRLAERDGQRIDVARLALDPRYNPQTSSSDAALIRLAEPAAQAPVALATEADAPHFAPGQPARVVGWGHVKEGGPESADVLYETDVAIDDQAACRDAYAAFEEQPIEIDDTMLCASAPGRDACQGDSGGPLVVDEAGGWRQVGVVSFGIGCARPEFPGVYARVPALLGFITDPDPVYAPFNTSPPIIGGLPAVGRKLHCRRGHWQGENTDFQYAWFRFRDGEMGRLIDAGQNLRPSGRERGMRVVCQAVGVNAGGFSAETSPAVRIGRG